MSVDSSSLLKSLGIAKGRGNELAELLTRLHASQTGTYQPSMAPLLPLLFRYDGEPVTLKNHFPMEPIFNYDTPPLVTLMCSRQVGKTLQMAMQTLIRCVWQAHWNVLFVAPFFETIRRVSTDYFALLVSQSPCRNLLTGPNCSRQVLDRSLPNLSRVRFTYAWRSADRARGIHAREIKLDEYQLMFPEVIPVITATMAASEYGNIITRAGTPLTNSNHLSVEFKEKSSRSHWMIPCRSCRKENIAALEYDLLGMIGPLRENISRDRPAIRCASQKCGYPLFPWDGQFVHLNPQNRLDHLGLHIPCVVLPMHCCKYEKWKNIWDLMSDHRIPNYTKMNEALGVPYDDGVTLLTQSDIERNAVLGRNSMAEIMPILDRYSGRLVIGVDWGGGGLSGESLTKVAICGFNHDGRVHVLFGMMFKSTDSTQKQAEIIHYLWQITRAPYIAHDNLGLGSGCEAMLIEKGVPASSLVPMEYAGETQGQIMRPRRATQDRPRPAVSIDKTRSMLHMIEAFRSGQILTFKAEKARHALDLLLDLTHLRAEERVWVHSVKSETVLIGKEPGTSDDFAHAIHFASNWLWYQYGMPVLTKQLILQATPQDLAEYLVGIATGLDPATREALFEAAANETLAG